MAPLSTLFTSAALLATGASAFTAPSQSTAVRPSTKLYENFGFEFAEDQVENTPQIILGEANYKKWVNSVDPDNMLNRQVSFLFVPSVVELGLVFERILFRRINIANENKNNMRQARIGTCYWVTWYSNGVKLSLDNLTTFSAGERLQGSHQMK